MSRRSRRLTGIAALVVVAAGALAAAPDDEPDVVVVQPVLIAFKGSLPAKQVDRSKKEARALAEELFEQAQAEDADFDAMVKQYTSDSYPGVYKLTNHDAPITGGAYQRKEMATRFGDVAFKLEVGEVGLAAYSVTASPYGWHIIKRLE
ncbi:MAG TPA: peptidylprolyl isomerase [Candidatus Polarisedimenticolaceae bacterium]|nr:peptidylprolyl isomerase [Candidatus Polarisedimenticolaceae bacterium]